MLLNDLQISLVHSNFLPASKTNMTEATTPTATVPPVSFFPAGERPAHYAVEPQGESSDRRILIVDDESAIRNLFAVFLGENYECETAASADEALAALATRTFALRVQAQLVHTEKMASLGQLSAGIAHELNNPAGFICGNVDFPPLIRSSERYQSEFALARRARVCAGTILSLPGSS